MEPKKKKRKEKEKKKKKELEQYTGIYFQGSGYVENIPQIVFKNSYLRRYKDHTKAQSVYLT